LHSCHKCQLNAHHHLVVSTLTVRSTEEAQLSADVNQAGTMLLEVTQLKAVQSEFHRLNHQEMFHLNQEWSTTD